MVAALTIWDLFVDVVTAVWLIIFGLSFIPEYESVCSILLLVLIPFFIADLAIRYSRVSNLKIFVRKHWIDIIVVIPYLRILRVARIVKATKAVKAIKTAKAVKTTSSIKVAGKAETTVKAIKKVMRLLRKTKK
jgi:hypothetical protein